MLDVENAKSAIINSNNEMLQKILCALSKEKIQELAFNYKATSATISMSGTWVERCEAKLIGPSGEIVANNIVLERGFKGWLKQSYDASNLHAASLAVLDANFTVDFDEDYFSPGKMLFGEEAGFPASSSSYEADCKSEQRIFDEYELEELDVDPGECEVVENDSEITLHNVYIKPSRLDIPLANNSTISIDVSGQVSHLVLWFVFALLFNSSGKRMDDLGGNAEIIKYFMEDNF